VQCTGIGVGASPIALERLVARRVGDDLAFLAGRCSLIGLSAPNLTTRIRWFSPAFPAEPSFAAARGSVVKV
jgi:hypothetical protein